MFAISVLALVLRLMKRQNFSQFSGASPFPVVDTTNRPTCASADQDQDRPG